MLDSSSPVRIIKRYPNRKLYDLTAKQYITLADIAALVQQDVAFQVIDHLTAQDMTTLVLTQVVLELAKTQQTSFSDRLLRSLIQAQGDARNFFFRVLGLDDNQVALEAMRDGPKAGHHAARHGVPTTRDWQRLEEQLAELERQVDRLLGK